MAIGKAATGKMMANYWLNTELVMADGKKMSRALTNTMTIEDLEKKGFSGKEIRFFLLSLHYRKALNFTWGALETARNTVRRINGFIQRLLRSPDGAGYADTDQLLYALKKQFSDAMDDDLNISSALAFLFDFVKRVNPPLVKGLLRAGEKKDVLEAMRKIDSVLAVMTFQEESLAPEAFRLLQAREDFRKKANWEAADQIRKQLSAMGIEVHDTPEGMTWTLI
jgi:cysteinyl-tRNA synthetase